MFFGRVFHSDRAALLNAVSTNELTNWKTVAYLTLFTYQVVFKFGFPTSVTASGIGH